MTPESLKEELRELILEIAEIESLSDATSFRDLGIDSMMGVEIVAAIERKYHIKIDDSELESVSTLNNSLQLVLRKLEGAQAPPSHA